MLEMIQNGLLSLFMGVGALTVQNVVMMAAGGGLLFLGIKKGYEPLLLVPIGFGAILVNIPLAGMMSEGGLLRHFYDFGVITEIFPCLIFIGIGAMTDFTPLLENPKILLLGAAGQFGIFLTLLLAMGLGFNLLDSVAIGIIGACDGPTSIYVTSKFAPHLLGAVSVAAYSYMALVPLIQPPIMRALTTDKERKVRMEYPAKSVSRNLKIMFPIAVTIVTCLIAPMGTPLMGMLMLGNLMKESGVVARLTKASENEIANIVTLLLGLAIGATMDGAAFLRGQTLLILGLGLLAICLDTVMGVLFGKLMCLLTGGRINPLIGAAGISAYPMAARVVQSEGRRYDTNNWLLMHAMGANTGGQVGSIMAAGIMLSVLKGLGLG
ncbi:MAG: sodium ion-translocating decarboxylase subunit beta [Syntrophobacteraceae bacterium]|jgi:oxaloacetate decarboxylase beta subunit|nr:sodium ion-translocating decarboxylase subunit beta [Syntrophobacteraceae bacterium]